MFVPAHANDVLLYSIRPLKFFRSTAV